MDRFNTSEYRRSRNAYLFQGAFEYFISLLVTDAFLAKVLTHIGINDSLIGIISSITSLAFVMQIMSLFVVKAKMSTKKLVMIFDTISIFVFMLLYIIPFTPWDTSTKTILVIIGILTAYASKYLIFSIAYKWGNSFVSPNKRATYAAGKEILSLTSGIAFTMVTGYIIDRYEGLGNIEGAFLFISAAIFVFNVCNFICFALMKKESEQMIVSDSKSMAEVIKNTLGKKEFRNIVLVMVLWEIGRYFSIGFLGVFKTNDLLLSVFFVQVINMLSSAFRIVLSRPFGRFSDSHSFATGFRVALYLAATAFFVNIFTTKSTWYLIIIHTVLYNVSLAGINANSNNILYSYVDSAYLSQALAIKNCISGLCGFGASLIAGKILGIVQANANMVLGLHIYGQQILAVLSFVFVIGAAIFIQIKIEKQNTVLK